MQNKPCIAITGATGFLGTRVIQDLVAKGDVDIVALGRRGSYKNLAERLESLWWNIPALKEAAGTKVRAIEYDITCENLNLSEEDEAYLVEHVTSIVHTAADVRPTTAEAQLNAVNVDGTAHVIALAKKINETGHFQKLVHISTAYVAGTDKGPVKEALLNTKEFSSNYEQGKAKAETLVAESGLPYAIVRPAMIVGDSQTGLVFSFNTVYYLLKKYLRGELSTAPVPASLQLNIIPVDYVSNIVVGALEKPSGFIANATMPAHLLPTAQEMANFTKEWAAKEGVAQLPTMKFIPVPGMSDLGRKRNLTSDEKGRGNLANMLTLAPYFGEERVYENEGAWSAASLEPASWRTCAEPLLAYAVAQGFLNHTDRTVFQQMGVRQTAHSTSIRYHDVTAQGIIDYNSKNIKEETEAIAKALYATGIRPGDRVATAGVNSVRYHMLDAACGLLGLVTVPLYYTTPCEEVVQLVERSQSVMLFAGTEKLLAGLETTPLSVPVVSMIDGHTSSTITSWETFMEGAQSFDGTLPAAPSPNALATIRYTSGTTGQPKGTMFTYGQLRWMGSTMASIIDWKTRTTPVRYLSFLPMSHVVEGILVSYAPYYLLTNVDMYYLQDFGSLEKALPQVRPNIFFSVPRFYEKIWGKFVATGAGKFFDSLSDGPLKRILAKPMRNVLLKKAGLSECRQLIVGSAPLGIDLQRKFESLGIIIHDAFGVTEAPLITLNRLGKNEPGSVGDLLPQTEIRLTEEGVVQVFGPQVTCGYDGMETGSLTEDGWFDTGDYGELSPTGHLILKGRKKDIMVTSYGKNIAPQKVETALKSIDGVSEAVLVGEGKPFVTALLWTDEADVENLEERVRAVNETLSHPERVKRWILAKQPLAISAGELTPNLKVRRAQVLETRAHLVDCLYNKWDTTPQDCIQKGQD